MVGLLARFSARRVAFLATVALLVAGMLSARFASRDWPKHDHGPISWTSAVTFALISALAADILAITLGGVGGLAGRLFFRKPFSLFTSTYWGAFYLIFVLLVTIVPQIL